MLGWIYLALTALIYDRFAEQSKQSEKYFKILFIGYAVYSIIFSTLHLLCTYTFVYLIWKFRKREHNPGSTLLKTALGFMLISTLGVGCLGPAVGLMGNTSAFFQVAIQFFLHFQFNGWIAFQQKDWESFLYYCCSFGRAHLCFATEWYLKNPLLYWVHAAGILTQLAAFVILYRSPLLLWFPCLELQQVRHNRLPLRNGKKSEQKIKSASDKSKEKTKQTATKEKEAAKKVTETAKKEPAKEKTKAVKAEESTTKKATTKAKKEVAAAKKETVSSTDKLSGEKYNGHQVYVGPKGGKYYINSNGNKTYISQK
ncbi:hypothetical protein FQR65_LT18007 [Abscondita terminalis]|nr:hypothetical protein FQR65_LT18007 [Abscondita terminalis]